MAVQQALLQYLSDKNQALYHYLKGVAVIIVRLMGGLGNQMFQYATALRLARMHKTDVWMDLSWYSNKKNNYRKYGLGCFRIKQLFVSDDLKMKFSKIPTSRIQIFLMRLCSFAKIAGPYELVFESGLNFDASVMSLPDNVALLGYWQSYKYFNDIRSNILKAYQPVKPISGDNASLCEDIKAASSVGLHVRRGDYVNNHRNHRIHGCCDLRYYLRSMEYIAERVKNPQFYIFSDDISWARRNLMISRNINYVNLNGIQDAWVDLNLMSYCKHNIIANSSFSWWAAWLNQNPDKIVIAPLEYYAKKALNKYTKDLFPPDWIRV